MMCVSYVSMLVVTVNQGAVKMKRRGPQWTHQLFTAYGVISVVIQLIAAVSISVTDEVKYSSIKQFASAFLALSCGCHMSYSLYSLRQIILNKNGVTLKGESTTSTYSIKQSGSPQSVGNISAIDKPGRDRLNTSDVSLKDTTQRKVPNSIPEESTANLGPTSMTNLNQDSTLSAAGKKDDRVEPNSPVKRSSFENIKCSPRKREMKIANICTKSMGDLRRERKQRKIQKLVAKLRNLVCFSIFLTVFASASTIAVGILTLYSDERYSDSINGLAVEFSISDDVLNFVVILCLAFQMYYAHGGGGKAKAKGSKRSLKC